jgi:hypothetical protein
MFVRRVLVPSLFAFVLLLAAAPASAQGPGVRAGVSVDPDQVYLGGHYETEELIEHVHLRPNLEVGFGDDVTTLAFNIEAIYKFSVASRRDMVFYAGGGPAINVYDFDNGSDTQGGLNLLGGIEFGKVFVEVKGGLFDSPNLKVGIGYTFR